MGVELPIPDTRKLENHVSIGNDELCHLSVFYCMEMKDRGFGDLLETLSTTGPTCP